MNRRLPPVASEEERLAAAKIAADRLCAELREVELGRRAWLADGSRRWDHSIEPSGAVISKQQP